MARRKKATMTDRQVIERAQRIATQYAMYTDDVSSSPTDAATLVEEYAGVLRTLLNQEAVPPEVDAGYQREFTRTQTEKIRGNFGAPTGASGTGPTSQSGNPAMIVGVDPHE